MLESAFCQQNCEKNYYMDLPSWNYPQTIVGLRFLSPAGREIIKCIPCVRVCVTFLKSSVHHTGCFSLAFSMFYDLIAYVFSFDVVFSDLGP